MAKRRNRQHRRSPTQVRIPSKPVRRDHSPIASGFTNPLLHPMPMLTPVSDRRTWRPRQLSEPTPRTVSGRVAGIRPRVSRRSLRVSFGLPLDAVICARRKIRREVIFAAGGAGRRGRRYRPRFNETSKYRC